MVFYVSLLCASLGAILAIAVGIVGWGVLPGIVDEQIKKTVVLKEGNEVFDTWKEMPFPLNFSVYIFQIANEVEFLNGDKPIMEERGPYVYKESRQKFNITRERGTLSYFERQLYEFDESNSVGSEDDKIKMLNMAMNTVIQVGENLPNLVLNSNTIREMFNTSSLVVEATVKEILFSGIAFCFQGKPRLACSQAKKDDSGSITQGEDGTLYFSILGKKNNSHSGHFKIKSGENDYRDLGNILEWKDESRMTLWPEYGLNDTVCNEIGGTDGGIFPPFLNKDSITVFSLDICRKVSSKYQGTYDVKGINVYRYLGTEDIVPAPSFEDGSICFCGNKTKGITQENGCLLKGVVDMFPCENTPVVLSFPHMLMADERYLDSVIGMEPDDEKHRILLEIEPLTGAPLRVENRVQFNMFTRRIEKFDFTHNLRTSLVPAIWLQEGFVLPDEQADELKELFGMLKLIKILKISLLTLGIVAFVGFTIVFICVKRKETRTV